MLEAGTAASPVLPRPEADTRRVGCVRQAHRITAVMAAA